MASTLRVDFDGSVSPRAGAPLAENAPEAAPEVAAAVVAERPARHVTSSVLASASPLAAGLKPAIVRGDSRAELRPAGLFSSGREEEARKLFAALQGQARALDASRNAVAQSLQQVMGGPSADNATRTFDGASREKALAVSANVATLQRYATELAAEIKKTDDEYLHPSFMQRILGDGFYGSAVSRLKERKVQLKAGTALFALMAPGSRDRSVTVSFADITAAIDRSSKQAAADAVALSQASTQASALVSTVTTRTAALRQSVASLNGDGSLFPLPAIETAVALGLDARVKSLTATAARDPLAVANDTVTARTLAQAEQLVALCKRGQQTMATVAPAQIKALQDAGLSVAWLQAEVGGIASDANALAEKIAGNTDQAAAIAALDGRVTGLTDHLARVVALDAERRGPETAAVADADALVKTAREAIADRLGVKAAAVLSEQGAAPADALAKARAQLATMKTALSAGDVSKATAARDSARAAVADVRGLVTEATNSVQTHAKTASDQLARRGALTATAANREGVVSGLESMYADSVSGPVRDALDGTTRSLGQIDARVNAAHTQYAGGAVIGASRALAVTARDLDTISANLDAIVAQQRSLASSDASNRQAVDSLMNEVRAVSAAANDGRTRSDARALAQSAIRFAGEVQNAVGASGRDPNALGGSISQAIQAVRNANGAIQGDWQLYAQADRAIDDVNAVLIGRAIYNRNSSFALEYVLWQTQIAGLRSQLRNGNYEGVINNARGMRTAIIAAAIAIDNAEREEEERRQAERRRAEEAAAERRRAEEAAERRRQEDEESRRRSSSGTGLPSGGYGSGSGTGLPSGSRSSGSGTGLGGGSGTGLSSSRKSGTGL